MKKPTIIFFGNTKYSKIGISIIHTTFPISLIVTKKIAINPVKELAAELKIPVTETNSLDEAIVEEISKIDPDFLVVEDYGLILPEKLLSLPKYASLNIHHSLLPKYRGPSPAPFTILNGDGISGVTIIKMVKEVDAGDILAQQEYVLQNTETTDSLLIKLNKLGGQLLVEAIKQYLTDKAQPVKQNHSEATYTKQFTKEDGYFDINNPPSPKILDRMIRAYYPWPGVWTKWNSKIVKFLPSRHPERSEGSSATMEDSSLITQNDRFLIQMEGKKVMLLKDFLNGYPDFPLKTF